jgi:hypothetical protein
MKKLWQQVDELLRGKSLYQGEATLEKLRPLQLTLAAVLFAAVYGFFMGWYGLFSRPEPEYRQVIACMLKVPALFLLTLFICYPSLYVFSTMLGSRLSFSGTLVLLMGIVVLSIVALASFGPIVAFFAVSTESYHFMKLLNVAFFAVAGFLGVGALLKALQSLVGAAPPANAVPATPIVPPVLTRKEELNSPERKVRQVFRIWILIYALVGAQMGWILRPFLGHPSLPFTWFRARQANFFVDVWHSIQKLFS